MSGWLPCDFLCFHFPITLMSFTSVEPLFYLVFLYSCHYSVYSVSSSVPLFVFVYSYVVVYILLHLHTWGAMPFFILMFYLRLLLQFFSIAKNTLNLAPFSFSSLHTFLYCAFYLCSKSSTALKYCFFQLLTHIFKIVSPPFFFSKLYTYNSEDHTHKMPHSSFKNETLYSKCHKHI